MTFEELYSLEDVSGLDEVQLNGWIVYIDEKLYLIEEDYKPDYKSCKRIEIKNDIGFLLEKNVAQIGGGESILFHKARIIGKLSKLPNLAILASEIYVDAWDEGLEKIDISKENVEKYQSMVANRPKLTEEEKEFWDWMNPYK